MKNPRFLGTALLILSSALAQGATPAPADKVADFGGVKLHYQTVGTGSKALVLVHGWTCSTEFWKQSIGAFPGYRVIAVDLPGHGQSDKPHVDYTMDYFARGVEAVMRDAKIDKAVLAGHSMGTSVIQRFYRLYPQRTLGLVFVDGLPWMDIKKEELEQIQKPYRINYRDAATQNVDHMLVPIHDEQLKQEIRSAMLATPDHVGAGAIDGSIAGLLQERQLMAHKITVPVLAILADSGPWKPTTEAMVRSAAPRLDYRIWPGVSHFLMMEKPTEFNATVNDFIVKNKLL